MLKYIGNGFALPGVPARDLTDEEVEAAGGEAFLLEPHPVVLYAKAGSGKETKKSIVGKTLSGDIEAIKAFVDSLEDGD
jgi:hypothetical protein